MGQTMFIHVMDYVYYMVKGYFNPPKVIPEVLELKCFCHHG